MQTRQWSQKFEVGISAIDKDHRTLFETIHELGQHIHSGDSADRVQATIHSLLLYVDEHFDREERFMMRAGYPDYSAHKDLHDQFRDSIYSLRDFQADHPEEVDAQKIVSFLESWLLNHILKVDKAYGPYLTGEKHGDVAALSHDQDDGLHRMEQIACPADKVDQVRHFIALIGDGSEEGQLMEAAVEKITTTQMKRRTQKARSLFGK